MNSLHERTVKVIGAAGLERLGAARFAVFGAGGVGAAAIEALARAGAGAIAVFDGDEYIESNLNRQLFATAATIGRRKAEVAAERIREIAPNTSATAHDMFVTPDNLGSIDFSGYDYVLDAIDNITAKLGIIAACKSAGTPVISCMGTGNKLDASRFRITDIAATSVCPLARVMRRELKLRGISGVDVLWSDESPVSSARPPGSVSFVPPVAGMLMAGFAVKTVAGLRSGTPSPNPCRGTFEKVPPDPLKTFGL